MAEQSLGNIILRLLVDNKAFKEGLVNALQLVQLTSTQIKDLTQFKITAPDITALDLALEAGEARVRDFIGAEQQIPAATKPVDEGLGASGKAHEQHGARVESGAQSVRGFFREQRLQDRVLGETRNSLVALTGSIIPFVSGTSAGSGASRQLAESLNVGLQQANAMEFALFGIGQVGAKLPGVLGAIAVSAGALAGPIAAAVGVGALLVSFARTTDEEFTRAARGGLREFAEMFDLLSRPQQLRLVDDAIRQIDLLDERIRSLGRIEVRSTGAVNFEQVQILTEEEQIQKTLLERDVTILREIVDSTREQREQAEAIARAQAVGEEKLLRVGTEIQRQDILIKRVREEIETRVDAEKKTALTVEGIRQKTDQLNTLEAERLRTFRSSLDIQRDFTTGVETLYQLGKASDTLLLVSLDRLRQQQLAQGDVNAARQTELKIQQTQQSLAADAVAIAETRKKLGIGTTEEILRALEAQKQTAVTEKDRLAISEKILTVKTEEANRQAEIAQSQVAAAGAALDKLEQFGKEAGVNAIQNTFEKQREIEQQRHEQRLNSIRTETQIAIDNGADVESANDAEKNANNAEDALNRANTAAIETNRQRELSDFKLFLLGNSTEAEIARINQTYDAERERVKQLFTDKNEQGAALAELEKRRQEELEAHKLNISLNSIEHIAAALQNAFDASGDSFIGKLTQALRIAAQIARTLQAAKLGEAGGGPLDIVASFLGIFSLFAEGGELPGGSYVVNEQQSKKHKPLLDAIGAGEVKGGTKGKDSVPFKVKGLADVAMLTPGERVVPPIFAPLARAINEGKPLNRLQFRATGGPIGGLLVRNDYLAELMSVVREYVQTVNPTLSANTLPIPSSVVELVRERIESQGGFNKEVFDSLIDEVRGLRDEIREMKSEIGGEIRGQRSDMRDQKVEGKVDIDNGKMFFRKHLPGALDFEADKST